MAPLSENQSDWLLCAADLCGTEMNCLSLEQWSERFAGMAAKEILHKKGCSGVKKYTIRGDTAASDESSSVHESAFADVILQSDKTDTEAVLPSADEAWKVYEARLTV